MKLCVILCLALLMVSVSGYKAEGLAPRTVASLRFEVQGLGGVEKAIAVWPIPVAPGERLPIVIAFHGLGESQLGPARGHAAWVERYGLRRAYAQLLGGVLTPASFGGLVRPAELAVLNAGLQQAPFQGVLTIGVYTPDLLGRPADDPAIATFAAWVARELVPQVQRAFPFASSEPRKVGVDGVSLGGLVALEVGLRFPEVFGSVGAIQPAVRGREAELAALADRARRRYPQRIQLLSSDDDPNLEATRTLSRELRKRRVGHRLVVTPGRHGYAYNRGPAGIEMLRFHDLALRGLSQ